MTAQEAIKALPGGVIISLPGCASTLFIQAFASDDVFFYSPHIGFDKHFAKPADLLEHFQNILDEGGGLEKLNL